MKKHTPAPWVATESDGEVVLVEALTKDRKHVTREICHVLDADEHTAANLRLIALAPELLDVLEGLVVNTDEHDFADESWWEAARNLIAQARGTPARRKCRACGDSPFVAGSLHNGICADCASTGGAE